MALPADYAEKLVEKLRNEAAKSYNEKVAKLEAKYQDYKRKIEERLDQAARSFAEKLSG